MPEMTCAVVEDLLDLYLDGETSPETGRLVEEHVAGCERCRAVLDYRRRLRAKLVRSAGLGAAGPGAGGGGGLDELPVADVRVVSRARARLRLTLAKALAVSLVAVVGAWAGVWHLTAPAPPGMYLARIDSSQIIVDGKAAMEIPFLWVPSRPGEEPPELWSVGVHFAGAKPLELKVASVTLEDTWFGLPHYRRGVIHAYQQDGVHVETGEGRSCFVPREPPLGPLWDDEGLPYVVKRATGVTVLGRGNMVIARTRDIDLTAVQMNVPWERGLGVDGLRLSLGMSFSEVRGPTIYSLHVEEVERSDIEVLDAVFPEDLQPLRIEREPSDEPARALPLEFPWTPSPGSAMVASFPPGVVGPGTLSPLLVVRCGDETVYLVASCTSWRVSGEAPLDQVYDLEGPG